ncbi:MAG: N-acetylmuramoyl-L-alanine amidase [Deltaproteobacteria bacterium]|nr:N-acetylmuramoyl-L-alanine amidase [Deltaproteobacteria bacterium]
MGVRYWSAPDYTRVVLDISAKIPYQCFTLTNPHRFVVDFKHTVTSFAHDNIPVSDTIVNQILFGHFKKDVLRIVFDLVQPVEAKLFTLEKFPGKSDRVVIELFRSDLKALTKENKTNISTDSENRKIIVIDPGHGGEDPGAIGPGGTKEKEIVLKFARCLKKMFDEKERYQAFLTRNGDYFLPLRKRVKIAEEYGAALFISVHTDSNRIKKTQGSTVYCLSLKGASDEAAKTMTSTLLFSTWL